MKAKLLFDLEDFADKRSLARALNATNAYIALHEIAEVFRQMNKYDREPITGEEFWRILESNNVDLSDLE